jgi:hypothetical protein
MRPSDVVAAILIRSQWTGDQTKGKPEFMFLVVNPAEPRNCSGKPEAVRQKTAAGKLQPRISRFRNLQLAVRLSRRDDIY